MVNYSHYSSPDPEDPLLGVLAAHAVARIATAMQDFLMKRVQATGLIRIEPPSNTQLPALKQYEYWQITGKIQVRTLDPEADTVTVLHTCGCQS